MLKRWFYWKCEAGIENYYNHSINLLEEFIFWVKSRYETKIEPTNIMEYGK